MSVAAACRLLLAAALGVGVHEGRRLAAVHTVGLRARSPVALILNQRAEPTLSDFRVRGRPQIVRYSGPHSLSLIHI